MLAGVLNERITALCSAQSEPKRAWLVANDWEMSMLSEGRGSLHVSVQYQELHDPV